jgi:curved DNA-binding protein CbpA
LPQGLKQPPDHYAALGLAANASLADIKKAFRQKASFYHPDKNDAPTRLSAFAAVQKAYEVLSDDEPRQAYDDNRRRNLLDDPLQTAQEIWQTYTQTFLPRETFSFFMTCARPTRPSWMTWFRTPRARMCCASGWPKSALRSAFGEDDGAGPEMVAVVFHQGFRFAKPSVMEHLLSQGADNLPEWGTLTGAVSLEPWAASLAQDRFARARRNRFHGRGGRAGVSAPACPLAPAAAQGDTDHDADEDAEDGAEHDDDYNALSADDAADPRNSRTRDEASSNWLAEVGFDRKD